MHCAVLPVVWFGLGRMCWWGWGVCVVVWMDLVGIVLGFGGAVSFGRDVGVGCLWMFLGAGRLWAR